MEIRWNTNQSPTTVEVTGLNEATLRDLQRMRWDGEAWQQVFAVYAGRSNLLQDVPPMLGNHSITNGCIRFEPGFPLEPGVTYRAVFLPSRLPATTNDTDKEVVSTFCLPATTRVSTTAVTRIYPSASVLPENLLKFYVYFSAPMRRGHIYDHIRLLDHAGNPVELPFLEIDEELWNPDMTRLTLFIDPGRIKRGVRPLEELGPVLEEGKTYTLVIDRNWQDAEGPPLKENYRKTFRADPAQRQPIVTDAWKITAPAVGSVEPLEILFPEPLDHALARRLLRVLDRKRQTIAGETSLGEEERRWRFVPVKAWVAGLYYIVVQPTIEDLAGNNIGKPFEVDVFEGVRRRVSDASVSLSFEVK